MSPKPMTPAEVLRIWNGPTSVCNRAKILQFAADLEAKRAERPANEKADEQALRIAKDMGFGLLVPQQARLIEFARRLRAESAQEPVARVNGTGVYWLEGLVPHGTLLYAAPVAKPASASERFEALIADSNTIHDLKPPFAKPAAQDCVSVPRAELEWMAGRYDDTRTQSALAMECYDMACTARKLLAASESKT